MLGPLWDEFRDAAQGKHASLVCWHPHAVHLFTSGSTGNLARGILIYPKLEYGLFGIEPPPTYSARARHATTILETIACYIITVVAAAVAPPSSGDMLFFHSYKNPGLVVDVVGDIRAINDSAMRATPRRTGMIILGGGETTQGTHALLQCWSNCSGTCVHVVCQAYSQACSAWLCMKH